MQEHESHKGVAISRDIEILVKAAIEGDRRSFESLIEIHHGGIFRMVYARTQSRSDTEDLVQDVFLKAYNSLSSLRSPELFKSWLYSIALNKVRDFRRRQRFTSLFSFSDDEKDQEHTASGPDSFDHLASKQFWRGINEFLKKLSNQQQEVFRLRFIDHLSIQEISLTLNRSESAIKTHLYRAIEKFKDEYPCQDMFSKEAL